MGKIWKMIRAALASLAGAWIARDVENGDIPVGLSTPLTLLATRLPAPMLIAGTIGYGLYRLNIDSRARKAKDVTPKRQAKSGTRSAAAKSPPRAKRQRA